MKDCLYKLFAVIFSFGVTLSGFSAVPPRQLIYRDNENIWFGTNHGLIRYQTENDFWSIVIADSISDFEVDDNVLWLGTEQGLYFADLRYLDWKKYSKEDGFSSNKIAGVATDIDYIYAAGSNWLARMDKLVEQWEPFGDFSHTSINDLYSDQDYLWVATDDGLYFYEKKFDKWKQFSSSDGLISEGVFRIFYFNDYLWIVADSGLSRYTIKMKSWNSYKLKSEIPGSTIKYVWVDADFIWLVTPENLVRFNSKNQVWENFSQNTRIEETEVNALSTSGAVSWFATSDGVYSYNEDQRRWIMYTTIEGLNDDEQKEIYCIGRFVVSKQGNVFNVYQASDDLWRSYEIAPNQGEGSDSDKSYFYNDERGIGFTTPGNQSISLLGTACFKLKNRAEFLDPLWDNIYKYIFSKDLDSLEYAKYNDYLFWWPKAQLNLSINLNEGRTIHGFFDNTGLIDSLKYGLEYRGYGDDQVRRAGWQKIQKTDYFHSTLIDPTYIEGVGVRTEFGRRVGEKKRRRVNTGVWAGWRKTKYIRKLIPFQEDNFYLLKINNIITESIEVRIDGKVVDPREYSIERTQGSLIFKNEAAINPDTRIEISCEYLQNDTIPGEYTNDLIALENVVVFDDNLSIGVNGVYHGFDEYDRKGIDYTKNNLVSGNMNSKIELKSADEKLTFKAIPEISTSYNDSILLIKQGTAVKLNASAVLHNFRLRGIAEYYTSFYETIADIFSIYGRKNYYGEFEAVYEITPFMPLSAGFNIIDAKHGNEISTFFEYLLAPSTKPSLRFFGLFQKRKNSRDAGIHFNDSLLVKRLNGRIESEWNISEQILDLMHLNRLWFNTSYSLEYSINDSNVTKDSNTIYNTGLYSDNISGTEYFERLNHNLFGKIQIAPHKKVSLETKQIFRYFQQKNSRSSSWEKMGFKYRPDYTLFSQEFIPGVTFHGKFKLERNSDIYGTDSTDTTGILSEKKLNSSILFIPGVWWQPLDPFQLKIGLNLTFENYDKTYDSLSINTNNNPIDTSYISGTLKITDQTSQSYTLNPVLDFGQDIHYSNRTSFSNQKQFDTLLTEKDFKMSNEFEFYIRDRKTKLLGEYEFLNKKEFNLSNSDNDSLIPDTSGESKVTRLIGIKNLKHEFLIQWTERWSNFLRTELPLKLSWDRYDSTLTGNFNDTAAKDISYNNSPGYVNSLNPGFLIDWRMEREYIRELRVQYFIGLSLTGGIFMDFRTYERTWQNKFDTSMKMGRNFYLRILLNLNYLFNERKLKYDLAELKAYALF